MLQPSFKNLDGFYYSCFCMSHYSWCHIYVFFLYEYPRQLGILMIKNDHERYVLSILFAPLLFLCFLFRFALLCGYMSQFESIQNKIRNGYLFKVYFGGFLKPLLSVECFPSDSFEDDACNKTNCPCGSMLWCQCYIGFCMLLRDVMNWQSNLRTDHKIFASECSKHTMGLCVCVYMNACVLYRIFLAFYSCSKAVFLSQILPDDSWVQVSITITSCIARGVLKSLPEVWRPEINLFKDISWHRSSEFITQGIMCTPQSPWGF